MLSITQSVSIEYYFFINNSYRKTLMKVFSKEDIAWNYSINECSVHIYIYIPYSNLIYLIFYLIIFFKKYLQIFIKNYLNDLTFQSL